MKFLGKIQYEASSTRSAWCYRLNFWAGINAVDLGRVARSCADAGSDGASRFFSHDVLSRFVVVHADVAREATSRYEHDDCCHGRRMDGDARYGAPVRSISKLHHYGHDLHDL